MQLYGYSNSLSYRAGDRISVMANTDIACEAQVDLVALRMENRKLIATKVDWQFSGRRHVDIHQHCVGSFVAVKSLAGAMPATFSVGAWIWPTLTDEAGQRQGILGNLDEIGQGFALALDGADLIFVGRTIDGDEIEVRIEKAVRVRAWTFVEAVVGKDEITLTAKPITDAGPWRDKSRPTVVRSLSVGIFAIGAGGAQRVDDGGNLARGIPVMPFNGKIERPYLHMSGLAPAERAAFASPALAVKSDAAGTIAVWDFAPGSGDDRAARDLGGKHPGVLVNLPARGVTGVTWSGEVMHFYQRPSEYAALHFHEDDLCDVGWTPIVEGHLPADLTCGVYGVRLRAGETEDIVPIIVTPTSPAAKVLVVMPTFTYLAYANEHMFSETWDSFVLTGKHGLKPGKLETDRVNAPQFGRSLYDRFRDGSGVMFSSSRRAILNHRVDYKMEWLLGDGGSGLGGDMYLVEWLQRKGIAFDIVTDHEIHRDPSVLQSYKAVLTGAHPEYSSAKLLDAYQHYRDSGGKIMYLGANGFYWVTGIVSDDPLIVEIRRGHAGIRTWMSDPGEVTLISTSEPGGLWRFRGRAPQRLVGTGFASQGQADGRPYVRSPASFQPEYAWIFEGVDREEIGTAGRVCNAAGGHETDRVDLKLGTPPQAVVLASATGFNDYYQRVIEELNQTLPIGHGGGVDPEVRADMVYFDVEGGGSVFSVSSIAWSGSMLTEAEDPGPSRITENVLRRFADLLSLYSSHLAHKLLGHQLINRIQIRAEAGLTRARSLASCFS